ncbi:MAG: ABC transporter substrate-binding protein, partial [Christensenellales bacterium]
MKKILCLIIVIASVFSVVGCSPGETDNGEEKKTVTVVYEADKVSYWTQIKTEFEKKYSAEGYKLSLIPVGGGQVEAKQTTMIAQNNAPDLILGGDIHLLNQYKYLMPLNELIERDNEEVDYEDFIPAITDTLTYNDNIYYLPEFFNVSLLYYNKGIFDQYNADPANADKLVEYPRSDWTYEEFYSAADALTKRSGNSVSQFGCYSTIGWWGEWLIHVRQSGGRFMNDDGYVCLDTKEAIQGVQRYYDKMYSSNRISNQKGTDDTYGDFSTGVFAM